MIINFMSWGGQHVDVHLLFHATSTVNNSSVIPNIHCATFT